VQSPPPTLSSGTYSYGKWSKGFADWQAMDEVTSQLTKPSSVAEGKKPMDDKDEDEDYIEDATNDDDDELIMTVMSDAMVT
jgi:hypothetical protein